MGLHLRVGPHFSPATSAGPQFSPRNICGAVSRRTGIYVEPAWGRVIRVLLQVRGSYLRRTCVGSRYTRSAAGSRAVGASSLLGVAFMRVLLQVRRWGVDGELAEAPPPTDNDDVAGDVGGQWAQKKPHHIGNLVGSSHAVEWDCRPPSSPESRQGWPSPSRFRSDQGRWR